MIYYDGQTNSHKTDIGEEWTITLDDPSPLHLPSHDEFTRTAWFNGQDVDRYTLMIRDKEHVTVQIDFFKKGDIQVYTSLDPMIVSIDINNRIIGIKPLYAYEEQATGSGTFYPYSVDRILIAEMSLNKIAMGTEKHGTQQSTEMWSLRLNDKDDDGDKKRYSIRKTTTRPPLLKSVSCATQRHETIHRETGFDICTIIERADGCVVLMTAGELSITLKPTKKKMSISPLMDMRIKNNVMMVSLDDDLTPARGIKLMIPPPTMNHTTINTLIQHRLKQEGVEITNATIQGTCYPHGLGMGYLENEPRPWYILHILDRFSIDELCAAASTYWPNDKVGQIIKTLLDMLPTPTKKPLYDRIHKQQLLTQRISRAKTIPRDNPEWSREVQTNHKRLKTPESWQYRLVDNLERAIKSAMEQSGVDVDNRMLMFKFVEGDHEILNNCLPPELLEDGDFDALVALFYLMDPVNTAPNNPQNVVIARTIWSMIGERTELEARLAELV